MARIPTIRLSKDFYLNEFLCHCDKCEPKAPLAELISKLQDIRNIILEPMLISSGVRCVEHNKKVGGKEDSFHLKGMAADIVCIGALHRHKLLSAAYQVGMRGVGIYPKFIHLDIRPVGGITWVG